MDIRKVKKLIELLEESGIGEIEIKEGEESVRISRGVSAVRRPPRLLMPPLWPNYPPAYAPPRHRPPPPAPAARPRG
jgi:acetyl-CoA carboxylase biotin carboxyl carrier protein